MYKKVDANLNFVDREKQIEKFWNDNDIFKKSMEHRKEGETYTFYDGPPTANGKPHIGHVETRTIKDMIPRYQTPRLFSRALPQSDEILLTLMHRHRTIRQDLLPQSQGQRKEILFPEGYIFSYWLT